MFVRMLPFETTKEWNKSMSFTGIAVIVGIVIAIVLFIGWIAWELYHAPLIDNELFSFPEIGEDGRKTLFFSRESGSEEDGGLEVANSKSN